MDDELACAIKAVKLACELSKNVLSSFRKDGPSQIKKGDHSPVTVADFAVQALINSILYDRFPGIPIIAEEDSHTLSETHGFREQIWSELEEIFRSHPDLGLVLTREDLHTYIDKGKCDEGPHRKFWTLDPIDGTLGFLRGEQYAICLSLIEDSRVQLAIVGCPNLMIDGIFGSSGMILLAERGKGSSMIDLGNVNENQPKLKIPIFQLPDWPDIIYCESVEQRHSNQGFAAAVAKELGINKRPLRMDSQAKYAAVAIGLAHIYLRLPSDHYQEKIWDHAPGSLIVHEANGKVSDFMGADLNFGTGKTLKKLNKGIIAAPKSIYPKVLKAVKAVMLRLPR